MTFSRCPRRVARSIWEALDLRPGTVKFCKAPRLDHSNNFPLNAESDILANDAAEQTQGDCSIDITSTMDLAAVKPRETSFGQR